MTVDWDELRVDLQAAARIGHPESLDWALDALRAWKALLANASLAEADVVQRLVPLGEVLAAPAVPDDYLHRLAAHPLAGMRALAAAALAVRALAGDGSATAALQRLAGDKRPEPRWALQEALRRHGGEPPRALEALLTGWLDCDASPRRAQTALDALDALLPQEAQRAWHLAARCRAAEDDGLQRALGEALRAIAAAGAAEEVLAGLSQWAAEPPTPRHAIVRALRGAWVQAHRPRAEAILQTLTARYGTWRALRRTLEALQTMP